MRRVKTLLLLACLCLGLTLGLSTQAGALEVTAGGQMVFQFGIRDNYGGADGAFQDGNADHFFARQRARIQVESINKRMNLCYALSNRRSICQSVQSVLFRTL